MNNNLFFGKKKIFTVYELTNLINTLLSENIGYVYIRGEISNLRISDAGHSYFTIKDDKSQISAVLFRGQNIKINFKDGSRVVVGGIVNVYPPRGAYQIIVSEVMIDGVGELHLRFEELKKRLYEEGLFANDIKKKLPDFAFHIGLITSPYGAAVRDFLKTALNKNPSVLISIYPAKVQGEDAARDVIDGIKYFNRGRDVDVIAIVRGGGSFEDLFCFNDEELAYAIRESKIPVITGIGHEIDYTIADYVADYRAATPTAAAECCVKSIADILKVISDNRERLDIAVSEPINEVEKVIQRFLKVFYRDKEIFDEKTEQLNTYIERLNSALRNSFSARYDRINMCNTIIERNSPMDIIRRYFQKVLLFNLRQKGAILNYLENTDNRVKYCITRLELSNPENILRKGYSVVYKDGKIISNVDELGIGDNIGVRFINGSIKALVKDKIK